MSSINTNAAAMTALQTLKATNKNMDVTQNRISTGYRVSEAAHNAAYWSIATTMRSDNNAMSTVKDALGLGAAQVDVAYTAMDVVKDTLDTMKKKIVAASQPDIDKGKIQEEIKQLQNDLTTYAKSATFSGGNWLDVEDTGTQRVVASFVRDASGAVSLKTIDVDTSRIALFVNGADSTSTGLLQGVIDLTVPPVPGEGDAAPDISAYSETASVTDGADEDLTFADFTTLAWEAGDTIAFNVDIEGTAVAVTGSFDGTVWAFDHTNPANYTITFDTSGDDLVVNVANAGGTDPSAVTVDGFTSERAAAEAPAGEALDVSSIGGPADAQVADGANSDFAFTDFDTFEWAAGDAISFTIDVDGTDVEVTGSFDGTDWTFEHTDPTDVTITFDTDAGLSINIANATGGDIDIVVGELSATRAGEAEGPTVTDFDITDMSVEEIGRLISHVDSVLSSVTSAASDLGAIKSRIDSQSSFVGKIMDAVNRGIGQLVDADMTEESSRLQALQIQQQLGIQSLSMANSNSQVILSLFR